MSIRPTLLLVVTTLAIFAGSSVHADEPAGDPPPFELNDGDRVVFLGNTLIERMQRYGHVEAALSAHFPDRDITFRNLGWSGDTVWAESRGIFDAPAKGYERMIEHVGRLKPTALFVAYGNVEAFAGEDRLDAFTQQYAKLLDDVTRASADGVRIAVLSPLPLETVTPPGVDVDGQNDRIELYAKAVRDLCDRRGHRYVDLAAYVKGVNGFHASKDAGEIRPLTTDGVQYTDFGYRQLATALPFHLGLHLGDNLMTVRFDGNGKPTFQHGCKLENVERAETGLRFDLTPTRLVREWIVTVDGAADESLTLRSGGREYEPDWGLPDTGTFSLPTHPHAEDLDALRRAIVEKNRMYFLRWRPLNVTYLTLFRKHEQGRHAKQAEEYDRLVERAEAEIAKLRRPRTRTIELSRTAE